MKLVRSNNTRQKNPVMPWGNHWILGIQYVSRSLSVATGIIRIFFFFYRKLKVATIHTLFVPFINFASICCKFGCHSVLMPQVFYSVVSHFISPNVFASRSGCLMNSIMHLSKVKPSKSYLQGQTALCATFLPRAGDSISRVLWMSSAGFVAFLYSNFFILWLQHPCHCCLVSCCYFLYRQ